MIVHRNRVEVFVLAPAQNPGEWCWRVRCADLDVGVDPDDVAWSLATSMESSPDVCHSTSWRWEPAVGIVLTYATLTSSPIENADGSMRHPVVVASRDPTHPRPPRIAPEHVAAHALVHLADLARRDPTIISVLKDPQKNEAWGALLQVADRIGTVAEESIRDELLNELNLLGGN